MLAIFRDVVWCLLGWAACKNIRLYILLCIFRCRCILLVSRSILWFCSIFGSIIGRTRWIAVKFGWLILLNSCFVRICRYLLIAILALIRDLICRAATLILFVLSYQSAWDLGKLERVVACLIRVLLRTLLVSWILLGSRCRLILISWFLNGGRANVVIAI
jgi:hypothetical protein